MLISAVKVCRELLQQGVQRLYEGYRAYATNTPPEWMQAVDAGAVRQVQLEMQSCSAHCAAEQCEPKCNVCQEPMTLNIADLDTGPD